MKTIRSFIAIPLTDDIRRQAARLIERLSESEDRIKWVAADNLHLTLKFLGDVDNTQVPDVCQVIRDVCQDYEPFDLAFEGVGAFPSLQRARILYAGVEDPSDSLRPIVAALEKRLAELGFKPEPRDYTPHLTLGRTRASGRRLHAETAERLDSEQDVDLGEMRAECVQLVASFLEKHGPHYQVMDTVTLNPA